MSDGIFKYPFAPEPFALQPQIMPERPPDPVIYDYHCDWCKVRFEFGENVLEVFDGVLVPSKKSNNPIVENFAHGEGMKRLHPGECFENWYIRNINDQADFGDRGPAFCSGCEAKLYGDDE